MAGGACIAAYVAVISGSSRHCQTREVISRARAQDGIECARSKPRDCEHREYGEQHYF